MKTIIKFHKEVFAKGYEFLKGYISFLYMIVLICLAIGLIGQVVVKLFS